MTGLTVVVGYGDAALDVLRHLPLHFEHPEVAVLDPDSVALMGALANGARIVPGDGRDICALRQAGTQFAARVVVAVPDDVDGLVITMAVRSLNPAAIIVAAVREPANQELFTAVGADDVFVRFRSA
ncbi:voltage-gated potassium channel [Lentzea xinjiangensis]|uniref:Voltage-gated potassium channel n=1 Tax=Lentzea xinjiangensis TaxID=402600 RepID=A0A1H9JZZ8_9PSEU|nr:NAD-binding protein [Lentzea xinjiangensis]SEQ92566.1 voltage-gated potassium channel [Lentzea xinjiangensis]